MSALATEASCPAGQLTPLGQLVLSALVQHRLLTTTQVHLAVAHDFVDGEYRPTCVRRHVQRELKELQRRGMADFVTARSRARERRWWATETGVTATEGAEVNSRAYRMDARKAAGAGQAHTLAVNDVGLAFLRAARTYGHDFGPLDWEHEIRHRIADKPLDGPTGNMLVADALVSYGYRTKSGDYRALRLLVELDRGTMTPDRLAKKLRAYALYAAYVPGADRPGASAAAAPAWQTAYPRFPSVVLVLTGLSTSRLQTRVRALRELADEDALVRRTEGRMQLLVTTLEQLETHGPWEPVFSPLTGPDAPVTVLGPRVRTDR